MLDCLTVGVDPGRSLVAETAEDRAPKSSVSNVRNERTLHSVHTLDNLAIVVICRVGRRCERVSVVKINDAIELTRDGS